MADETVKLENVRCIASTGKAALCTGGPLGSREVWFPQSQIDEDSEVYARGTSGSLVITMWIAREKDLVDDDGNLKGNDTPTKQTKKPSTKAAPKKASEKSGTCSICGKSCNPRFDTCWNCKTNAAGSAGEEIDIE